MGLRKSIKRLVSVVLTSACIYAAPLTCGQVKTDRGWGHGTGNAQSGLKGLVGASTLLTPSLPCIPWLHVYQVYQCHVYQVYLYHVNYVCHFVPSIPCAPSRASSASLILEALGCAQNWYEANVLSTLDLSSHPSKVWGWLLKSWENKQSYAERLFFQSRNFLANLFWHQIDPDTDSWHWNVGCNFHLETVGWLPARVSWVSWQLEGLLPLQRCTPSPLHPETILRYLRNKSSQVEWVQFRCLGYKGHLSTGRREYICKKSKAFIFYTFCIFDQM